MSKADQLGAGRFAGAQTRGVSARRQAVAAATGVPTEGIADPTELPVHRISPNPDNPRTSLGDLSDLAGSLKDHGQKQAITVMNRDAYVKANPDREGDLEPDTTHVVIDGSSRLAAARDAGLSAVKVMVSDDQGGTADELLESALVANIHRQDLEELDEARALERLLSIHGSQTALAKRLHRSQGWVSQRLALLNLTPELQARIGQEPIDLLRAVGNKPADQQQNVLEELKEQRARKEAEKEERKVQKAEKRETVSQPPEAVPVSTSTPPTTVVEAEDNPPADVTSPLLHSEAPAPKPAETVPEPRTQPASTAAKNTEAPPRTPPKLPYDDGVFIALHLIAKMNDIEFTKMLHMLNDHQEKKVAARRTA
ncbi:ParB/RepB/Spo0J family partition protein [Streptomyces sp. NBC_01176]|uniref:ParB/RepB/Spo0J family partition protein n=1 Tax=Streptomyces sp. NBC_01176 TaxID=2903760 RepID=UPI002F9129E4|nr:ParB/RepB/Spo0J family partition protein [Streptomyces sp. NBC_01176]